MFLELRKILSNSFSSFLNLIYKQKCLICACSKVDENLCKNCLKDVHYLSTFPHKIYKEVPIFSMAIYQGTIKILIQLLKFSHKKMAGKILSQLLFNYFQKLNLKDDFIIIYPPSFFLKTANRGYNHMNLIAKYFSKLTNFEINNKLISKVKYTKPQYQAKNRFKNIENSFNLNLKELEKIKDKKILLIDDITTSGATLEEIINCFLNYDFKNIICLTISKAGKI